MRDLVAMAREGAAEAGVVATLGMVMLLAIGVALVPLLVWMLFVLRSTV